MRHGQSSNRRRNRNNNSNNGGNRSRGGNKSRVYDSNGPDVRIRGTAHQISEKYQALASDASSTGNYIMSESYLQHAEHYLRIIGAMAPPVRQENQGQKPAAEEKAVSDDSDLSLPASIVGAKSDVESQEKIAETA